VDTTSLRPLIERFLASQTDDPIIVQQLEEHHRRTETAQRLLQLDHIPDLQREELEAFLQDTDAWYGLRWNKSEYWIRVFGENDEKLPAFRETMADLVRRAEAGLTADDFNELRAALPGIGPAYLSEILALCFSDRYWLLNVQIRRFFEAQGIDLKAELPWGKKGNHGEQYLLAGRHLSDLRRAISEVADRPVDYMFTDLFVFWANQQEGVGHLTDPWMERITRWREKEVPPERIKARREGESRARARLEEKIGAFDEADLRQFLEDMSSDWYNGGPRKDRFMPALYGAQVNRMIETLDKFNDWVPRLWQADDAELDQLLDEFWKKLEVSGAGVSLPTAILYLRDPDTYNIWLPVMSRGLEAVIGFEPGKMRTARGYRHYNAAANDFRAQYNLAPQETDIVLWIIALAVGSKEESFSFSGFTEDTFRFLQDLAANNTEEWMAQDDGAQKRRYRNVLREPLRELLKAVAPTVAEMDPTFETRVKFGKVLAGFHKRFPDEEGAYHTYLWGAFYRRGRSKQTDAQLFVNVHPTHVNVGFCVAGSRGSDVLERFRRNLEHDPHLFLQLLADLPEGVHITMAEEHGVQEEEILTVTTADDLAPLYEAELINIQRQYPIDAPVLYGPELVDEVETLFLALYPIYRFATTEDVSELPLVPEPVGDEDEDEELYELAHLCTDTFLDVGFWQEVELLLREKKQLVFYGPPGTGKTWVARQFARYWIDAAAEPGGDVQVVQFHPSYAYEEFVEGIRPQSVEGADGRRELSYPVKKGLFRRFCEQARTYPRRRYVLILDEINRGELPRILGELLYLLEYRRESVVLPYSGERFAIPSNVYLLGTMNTADRSIALVDHALRRRFHFVDMKPDSDVLRRYFIDGEMAWTADLLDQVNHQLEEDGIEWHLHIGHSHFMREDLDEVRLRLIWDHSITPTLEEYFYRQPDRLQAYRLVTLKAALGQV
jgi:uncharacterized protein (DUF2461 family)